MKNYLKSLGLMFIYMIIPVVVSNFVGETYPYIANVVWFVFGGTCIEHLIALGLQKPIFEPKT